MVSPGHRSQVLQEYHLCDGYALLFWLVHNCCRYASVWGWLLVWLAVKPSHDCCRLSGMWDQPPGQEPFWGHASPGRGCLPALVGRVPLWRGSGAGRGCLLDVLGQGATLEAGASNF